MRGRVPARAPATPTGQLRAGAAAVDLTPPPGYGMGGHSWTGQVGRGYWLRLGGQAIAVEDGRGYEVVLVAADLWALPGGLGDRVAELVATRSGRPLGREQLLIAASHTHHSPAAFSTDPFFTTFAANRIGFDPNLFEFLAARLADAVIRARAALAPARIVLETRVVAGTFRNRSMPPFLADPESAELLAENAGLPECADQPDYPDRRACRAVDPRVTVLRFERTTAPGTIAVAALMAVHTTTIDAHSAVYDSDLFGAIRWLVAGRFVAAGKPAPVVALFNGAEGDVSPDWKCQDRPTVVALAEPLAAAITDAVKAPGRDVGDQVNSRLAELVLPGATVSGNHARPLDSVGYPGASTTNGAEDGRSGWPYSIIAHEGIRGSDRGEQGTKIGALDPRAFGWRLLPFSVTKQFVGRFSPPPDRVRLGIYRLGDVVLVGLPGEFTTILGRRILEGVRSALGAGKEAPIRAVGLANGYGHYFTTPEEYALQHYEGSSTLYGTMSGAVMVDRFRALAATFGPEPPQPLDVSYAYDAGPRADFDVQQVRVDPRDTKGLEGLLRSAPCSGATVPVAIQCWNDATPDLAQHDAAAGRVTPRLRVDVESPPGTWRPLTIDGMAEDDAGLRFITTGRGLGDGRTEWCARWLVPAAADRGARYQFQVERLDGTRDPAGPPFRIP